MGEVRIGDRERELAMSALDEHLRAGRLEPTEYAERSAVASTARVRSELDALFGDLPDPHPVYPGAAATPEDSRPVEAPPPRPERDDELPELVVPVGAVLGRHAGTLAVFAPIIALALFAVTGFRFPMIFFLVPVAIGVLGWLGHRYGS